ncbi:MAG: epoxyqueuosine reductase QueH [Lachnospiraceae bacterium]|nr:epoxyqueuosine reductase QueH [Lachnospiraceae bacterium]
MQKDLAKVNYQRVLDETLKQITENGKTPSLLLHACCAPCSSYVLEYLSKYFNITVFYYNPNIFPKEEYEKRVEEIARLIEEISVVHPVKLLLGNYDPERFFAMARGMEESPEGGERCFACYRLRLSLAAKEAKERGFDYFTTTLSISPLKNAAKLNEIGRELSDTYKVAYLYSDFKKKGGYQRSIELSREFHLYRQNYCGCIYSRRKENCKEITKNSKE